MHSVTIRGYLNFYQVCIYHPNKTKRIRLPSVAVTWLKSAAAGPTQRKKPSITFYGRAGTNMTRIVANNPFAFPPSMEVINVSDTIPEKESLELSRQQTVVQ